MGIEYITLLIVFAMIGMMMAGIPLAWTTLSVAVAATLLWFGPLGLPLVTSRIFGFVTEYVFVAVPMFVLMASLMERSGVARDLYDAMSLIAGRLPGGVAVQTSLVAVVMAAMTGIVGGEIVLLGLIALPQMLRLGYDRRLSIGTIVAGGTLGTMIPPSIVLIFYGLVANVSIGKLFMAAVVPGLLLAALYISYIVIRCTIDPSLAPRQETQASRADILRLAKGLALPLLIIVWVLGSIYGGIASITEAAAVGVVASIFSAWLRMELSWTMVRESLVQTMTTVGSLLWITLGANALVGIYSVMGGTAFLRDAMTGLPFPPLAILLLIMLILLILGTFIDWIGILLLTMPIFVPVIVALGYDPIWFGILFCMNMQVSFLSPPFGPSAFYLKSVAPPDISLQEIFASLWPFICLQIVALAIVIAFPQIALWLPASLY